MFRAVHLIYFAMIIVIIFGDEIGITTYSNTECCFSGVVTYYYQIVTDRDHTVRALQEHIVCIAPTYQFVSADQTTSGAEIILFKGGEKPRIREGKYFEHRVVGSGEDPQSIGKDDVLMYLRRLSYHWNIQRDPSEGHWSLDTSIYWGKIKQETHRDTWHKFSYGAVIISDTKHNPLLVREHGVLVEEPEGAAGSRGETGTATASGTSGTSAVAVKKARREYNNIYALYAGFVYDEEVESARRERESKLLDMERDVIEELIQRRMQNKNNIARRKSRKKSKY